MATITLLMILFFSSTIVTATVHIVGDSQGWSISPVDYKTWSSAHKFYVGDELVFSYNPAYHNVVQVTQDEYDSCEVTSPPVAVYSTGNDTVVLNKIGEYYYLCGVPGHCQFGQKVAVTVADTRPEALLPTAPAPSLASSEGAVPPHASSKPAAPAPTSSTPARPSSTPPAPAHTNSASVSSVSLIRLLVGTLVVGGLVF